jgi:cysteinyl-tRNA synthetase
VFDEAISNDLATPEVLTAVEAILGARKMPAAKRIQSIRMADELLGLNLLGLSREELRLNPADAPIEVSEIDRLIAQRKEARAGKDFAASDAIRDALAAKGVEVMDGDALGWEWKL